MKRKITFFRSAARMAIPGEYYRDLGSPPFFQLVNHKNKYELRPAQKARKNGVYLSVRKVTIRSEKTDYLQHVLILPVKYAGGGKREPVKIEAEVDWRLADGKLHGFIQKRNARENGEPQKAKG